MPSCFSTTTDGASEWHDAAIGPLSLCESIGNFKTNWNVVNCEKNGLALDNNEQEVGIKSWNLIRFLTV